MSKTAKDVLTRWADDTACDHLAFDVAADQILAALASAGFAVVPLPYTAEICHACQRKVERLRGSPWHGSHRICPDCFAQWYDLDYDDVDPTSALSVGNATRRKLGIPLLVAEPNP